MFYIEIFIYYLIAINIIAFIVYGIDKFKATKGYWRIPESTLLLLAIIGGSVGAWLGMMLWHHKTKHWKFMIGVPAVFFFHLSLIAYVYWKY